MIENAFGIVGLIAIVVLTFTLWALYHKYVQKIYFGNMLTSIVIELFICGIISLFIVSAVGSIIVVAVQGVGSILLFIIKLFLKILGIAIKIAIAAGIIYIIYKVIKYLFNRNEDKNKQESSDEPGTVEPDVFNNNSNANTKDIQSKNDNDKELKTAKEESYVVCPKCGAKNKDVKGKYCIQCGAELSHNEDSDIEEEVFKNEKQNLVCPKCGMTVKEKDMFCINCGADLRNNKL